MNYSAARQATAKQKETPINKHVSEVWTSINHQTHGLRTPNEGINQQYLKNWAYVADKICFSRT